MAKQTGSYDFKAAKAAHDEASQKATNYIFKSTGHDAWVCDEDAGPNPSTGEPYGPSSAKPTTGWRIGNVFELVRRGISWFKLSVEPKLRLRLGLESSGYTVLDDTGMEVFNNSDSIAKFGESGARIGKPSELATFMSKNGFSICSDLTNDGEPLFSVTMPETVGTEQIAFAEVLDRSSIFPVEIDLEYSDGTDEHPLTSVYDLYKITVTGYDSLPMVAQDAILSIERGNLSGNGGVLPSYITGYNAADHKIIVDRIDALDDVLDAHPYALIKGILADDITYEQPQMLFDVDGGGSMYVDYHSLQLIDKEGETYFHVGDLRESDGSIVDRFIGDGQTSSFFLSAEADSPSASTTAVTVDGVAQTWGFGSERPYTVSNHTASALGNYSLLDFPNNAPADGAVIVVEYIPSGDMKFLTFGTRTHQGPVGGSSAVFGKDCEARAEHTFAQGKGTVASLPAQSVFGRYNEKDINDEYAFIIGNGTADNARGNALALKWDGTVDSSIAGVGANTWVEMLRGRAALYVPKDHSNSTTSNYAVGAIVLETAGKGAWAIANYNDEQLQFVYITPANRSEFTNTVTSVKIPTTGGTVCMTGHNHAAGDINSGTLSQARGGTGQGSLYKTITGSGTYSTLASGSYVQVSITLSPPTGYTPVAFWRIQTGRERICVVNFNIASRTSCTVGIRNDSSTSASGASVSVTMLCLPTAS